MLGHLKYIVGAYNQDEDDRGVYPISLMDANVIMKIIRILKHRGLYDLSKILQEWKKNDDNDFLDQLDEFMEEQGVDESAYEDVIDLDGEGEVPVSKKHMIDIQGHIFEVNNIFRIDKEDYYDEEHCYGLIINKSPIPAKDNWYEDTQIKFDSMEDRDEYFDELKKKLEKFKNVEFI